jgi:hypothetical protein
MHVLKRVCLGVLVLAIALLAQQDFMRQQLYFYDSSGNLEYACATASEGRGTATWTTAAQTLTNVVDAANTATATTSTAHGLTVGVTVTIAGVSVDTDLNGTYAVVTTPTPTTFTVTTANVTDATYTDAGLTLRHTGPRTTAEIWSIRRYLYDASGNLFKIASAVSGTAPPGRVGNTLVCADRTTYQYR